MKRFGVSVSACVAAFGLLAAGAGPLPAQKKEEGKGVKVLTFEIEKRPGDDRPVDTRTLAEMLKKRIDPNDLYNITIRPAGTEGRVEIILPTGNAPKGSKNLTAADVERIRNLVARVGALEFAIVANAVDDKEAIEEARKHINEQTKQEDLKVLAERGQSPPVVRDPKTGAPKTYMITLAKGEKSVVAYRWVELGPSERMTLSLNNAVKDDPKRNHVWQQAAKARGKAAQFTHTPDVDRLVMRGALFYSHECVDKSLPAEERGAKAVEYFVLVREPELDPKTGKATPRVDGSYLVMAMSAKNQGGTPAVVFSFNQQGGQLFGNLTGKNVPSGKEEDQHRRHLAIILDGMVLSSPTINSQITTIGQISGNFTQAEIDRLVDILRSGALPAKLRPVETEKTGGK
jgi:preprotein translocase subunit SecD